MDGIPSYRVPPPLTLWSNDVLPIGWKHGGSLPSSVLQAALLAASQRLENQTKDTARTLPPQRQSVIKATPPKDITKPIPVPAPSTNTSVWANVNTIEYADKSPTEDEVEVIKVKKAPETIQVIGKARVNPVKPSHETVAACTEHVTLHNNFDLTEDYECHQCSYRTEWAGTLFEHMRVTHGLPVPQTSTDPLLYFLAEQNEALMARMNEQDEILKETLSKLDHQQTMISAILEKQKQTPDMTDNNMKPQVTIH